VSGRPAGGARWPCCCAWKLPRQRVGQCAAAGVREKRASGAAGYPGGPQGWQQGGYPAQQGWQQGGYPAQQGWQQGGPQPYGQPPPQHYQVPGPPGLCEGLQTVARLSMQKHSRLQPSGQPCAQRRQMAARFAPCLSTAAAAPPRHACLGIVPFTHCHLGCSLFHKL